MFCCLLLLALTCWINVRIGSQEITREIDREDEDMNSCESFFSVKFCCEGKNLDGS